MAGESVLVVDDSLVYQDLVVNHVLKPNGYEPLRAQDGETGLRIALQEKPDLLIIDLLMPGMTGIELLEALHEAGSEIPVIMMTLHGSEDLVVRAFRLGLKDYVIKPFDVEEMLAAIDRALTEMRLRRERDALTQELVELNRRLEAVLTNTADAVLLVEENDRVILANEATRQAFEMEGSVTGRPLAEVVDDEILLDVFCRAKNSEKPARTEISLPDDRTLNAHVTPIAGVGRVAVMQDITYLKELDRMKSEFVSAASHDLRSPLTAIKGFADLMPTAGPLNEQQIYFLDKIQRGVEMIARLVSDLLDLGRIEAEVRMDMELCDLGAIVEKIVAGQQGQAELKKQALQMQIAPDLPPVQGNPLRLGQVVSNLVGNAIKYTPEEGRISVSVAVEEGQLVMTVEDDGIGIPQEDLAHVFDKFYRVKSPETDNIIGSGLGLSIVKSIIEKHRGRVWVRSEIGVGSAFIFVLPAIA
jgi:two-component system, OmpR family, phosphate regulon sensor histidine kinase PhoR